MDRRGFDDVARRVAGTRSRRDAIALAVGAALAAGFAATDVSAGKN